MTIDELRKEIGPGLHHPGISVHGFLSIRVVKTKHDGFWNETTVVEELGTITAIEFDESNDCMVFCVGEGVPTEIQNYSY